MLILESSSLDPKAFYMVVPCVWIPKHPIVNSSLEIHQLWVIGLILEVLYILYKFK